MIGLASPYLTDNYGTKLQAYALQHAVGAMGYENEIIDYRFLEKKKPSVRNFLYGGALRYRLRMRKRQKDNADPQVREGRSVRAAEFRKFTDSRFVFSPVCNTLKDARKLAEKYDAVICGSDQIWLPSHISHDYYTLNFVPEGVKRISYAPSFGVGKIPFAFRKSYSAFLNKLDTITVREIRGAELVKELTGKNCDVVLDPTLLRTKQDWMQDLDITAAEDGKKYVFAYFIGSNQEHRAAAKQYAEDHGCKLILLPNVSEVVPADTTYADEAPYNISPREFVELIANAQAVFTDSFHGSVFSIIFERELFVCERFNPKSRQSTNSRIYSLLQLTGMEDRLILGSDARQPEQCGSINYPLVKGKVEQLRQNSLNILRKALEEK